MSGFDDLKQRVWAKVKSLTPSLPVAHADGWGAPVKKPKAVVAATQTVPEVSEYIPPPNPGKYEDLTRESKGSIRFFFHLASAFSGRICVKFDTNCIDFTPLYGSFGSGIKSSLIKEFVQDLMLFHYAHMRPVFSPEKSAGSILLVLLRNPQNPILYLSLAYKFHIRLSFNNDFTQFHPGSWNVVSYSCYFAISPPEVLSLAQETFEGFKIEVSRSFTEGFGINHSVTMGEHQQGKPPSNYTIMAHWTNRIATMFGMMSTQGELRGRYIHELSQRLNFAAGVQISRERKNEESTVFDTEMTYKGRDFTATGRMSHQTAPQGVRYSTHWYKGHAIIQY